ncbi:F-box only protein 36 isoform X2 [Leptonychotes weddellii]|uniref:F-box only protein 36 isoform X2 n=1 Tax=Leptonychotes weddellii TaxID=9713 RepID=A0A7F8REQ9_LEPWE|nr:F-box only protein 36 isoform X2 [Leptonychotes weddellii]
MASWLPETLFEIVGQGPAPSKDYYQLLVTRSQVIFRWWKISLRSEYRSTKPGEAKESHEEFLENSHLQVRSGLGLCPESRIALPSSRSCPRLSPTKRGSWCTCAHRVSPAAYRPQELGSDVATSFSMLDSTWRSHRMKIAVPLCLHRQLSCGRITLLCV